MNTSESAKVNRIYVKSTTQVLIGEDYLFLRCVAS